MHSVARAKDRDDAFHGRRTGYSGGRIVSCSNMGRQLEETGQCGGSDSGARMFDIDVRYAVQFVRGTLTILVMYQWVDKGGISRK